MTNKLTQINQFNIDKLMSQMYAFYSLDTDESNDFEVWDIIYTRDLPELLRKEEYYQIEMEKYVEYLKSLGEEVMKNRLLNNDYVLYDEVKNWFDKKNPVI